MALARIMLNFDNGHKAALAFRDQSKADREVIKQIFVNRHYDLTRLARARDIAAEYTRILSMGRTPLIVDCGANIGASAIWFVQSFPRARVVALEPEQKNSEILQLNCAAYSNIKAMRAAISCADETLYVEDPGCGDWGFRTTREPAGGGASVRAYSVETIARENADADLFIVKIDIEGGEARLFESDYSWIERAMLIVIELHDWMLPGIANSQNCLKALSGYKRDVVFAGENLFSIRNPF